MLKEMLLLSTHKIIIIMFWLRNKKFLNYALLSRGLASDLLDKSIVMILIIVKIGYMGESTKFSKSETLKI